jgi:hypothetical protein
MFRFRAKEEAAEEKRGSNDRESGPQRSWIAAARPGLRQRGCGRIRSHYRALRKGRRASPLFPRKFNDVAARASIGCPGKVGFDAVFADFVNVDVIRCCLDSETVWNRTSPSCIGREAGAYHAGVFLEERDGVSDARNECPRARSVDAPFRIELDRRVFRRDREETPGFVESPTLVVASTKDAIGFKREGCVWAPVAGKTYEHPIRKALGVLQQDTLLAKPGESRRGIDVCVSVAVRTQRHDRHDDKSNTTFLNHTRDAGHGRRTLHCSMRLGSCVDMLVVRRVLLFICGLGLLGGLAMLAMDLSPRDHLEPAPVPPARMLTIPSAAVSAYSLAVEVGPVTIDGLEVSVGEYERCVRAGACPFFDTAATIVADMGDRAGSVHCSGGRPDRREAPMNCVDYAAAEAYCRWVGKRLPTRDEWWAAFALRHEERLGEVHRKALDEGWRYGEWTATAPSVRGRGDIAAARYVVSWLYETRSEEVASKRHGVPRSSAYGLASRSHQIGFRCAQ